MKQHAVNPSIITTCQLCGGTWKTEACDCCGLWYCRECAARPDEGGNNCPNEECNLHPC